MSQHSQFCSFHFLTQGCYCVAHFGEQINFLHKEFLSQVVHSISNESIISRGRGRERERKVHRQLARVEGSFRGPCTENCRSCWVSVQDLSLPQQQRLSRIVVSLGIHTKLCPFCRNLRCQMVAHLVIVLLESSEECPHPS